MGASLHRAQAHTSSLRIKINTRLLIMGDRTTKTKKRQCFKHGSHFNGVDGVNSGNRESQIDLGGNDGTKRDQDVPQSDREITPSSKDFTINDTNTKICTNSPPMIIIAQFRCDGTIIGEMGIPELGLV